MSRPLRILFEDAHYHVMNRGINRQQIFHDEEDRAKFFSLLNDIYEMWRVETVAFCFLDNHYHLLLHTPNPNISRAMRHLNGVYTQYFNRKNNSDGPLFRGRYKSVLVEKDSYLLELIRYIHNNPVKAGLCKQPKDFRWSSHRAYVNNKFRPQFLVIDDVLREFSRKYSIAGKKFDEFVRSKGNDVDRVELLMNQKKAPSILGSKGFLEWVKENYIDRNAKEIPEMRKVMRHRTTNEEIINLILCQYDITKRELLYPRAKAKNEARSMLVYLMRYLTENSYNEIAKVLGGIDGKSASKIVERFRKRLVIDKDLKTKTDVFCRQFY